MWTGDDLQRLVSRELSDYRLIVVSNRQPYAFRVDDDGALRGEMPPGGLTAAIDPLMRACGGAWIAQSSGAHDRAAMDEQGRIPVPPDAPAYSMRLLNLSEEENDGYYYGFANEGLWPLCHIAYTEPLFDAAHFGFYQSVNRRFADLVLDEIGSDPAIVLIQDYHLALLPRYIREINQDVIIGQFWHIPWPGPDILRICPWQSEILDGMLGNDLLGFHLSGDCQNFMNGVAANLNARIDPAYGLIDYRNETTLVRPFPISIDFDHLDREARTEEVGAEMERLTRKLGLNRGRILGLGIDRQDYTKGIPHRLRAVERLLEKRPEYRGRLVFLQAGAASRTNINSYMQLTVDIQATVDRINGRFGHEGWQPILYWPTSLPAATFSALRRLASFCAESSLHDGMNLVAKEYVASQIDDDGVLILSAFAGSAQELTDSLIINPYATEQFADAIHRALTMDDTERRQRMRRMRGTVRENNIYKWAGRIMMHLMQASTPDHSGVPSEAASEVASYAPASVPETGVVPPRRNGNGIMPFGAGGEALAGDAADQWPDLLRRIDGLPSVLLLLDFDGTLSEIASSPEVAVLRPGNAALLEDLSRRSGYAVGVISGRSLDDVAERVGVPGLVYAGNHGLEIRGGGMEYRHPVANAAVSAMTEAADSLAEALASIPGAMVENKGLTLTVHYRRTPSELQGRVMAVFRDAVQPLITGRLCRVTVAKAALELRPAVDWHKGRAVELIRYRVAPEAYPVYIGDDATDEDAFRAAQDAGGAGVFVGPPDGDTCAGWRLDSPADVTATLADLMRL